MSESPPVLQRTLGEEFGLPEEVADQVRAVERGRLTDERLREAIVRLRGAGVSIRVVCQALGVHAEVVSLAEREDPELVSTLKERRARAWELVESMCAEGLVEAIQAGKLPPGQMGLTGGIAGTKAAEARGQSPVEHRHEVRITLEDARQAQAELVERLRSKLPQVIDLPAQKGEAADA